MAIDPVKKKKKIASGDKLSRVELMKKRREELGKKGGGKLNYFIFKDGTVRMRPLPAPEDEEFALEVTFFYLSKEQGGVISPITFGEPCAIMEAYNELKASEDEDDKALAQKLKPKRRYMMMHIKYLDEKGLKVDEESGAKLALLTSQAYQDLCNLFLDEEQGDFSDPINGYDIKYRRTGSGQFDTEYSLTPCKPSKLPKKYNKVYDTRAEVEKLIPSYEETEAMVKAFLKLPDEDEDEPKPKKKKKKIRRDV